ncbi:MAG: hypothetical protein AB1403_24905, partial [Candidatus Riflebacteria bacterium]
VFLEGTVDELPKSGIDAIVAGILAKRKTNRNESMAKAKLASSLTQVNDVADVVSAKPSGGNSLPEISVGTQSPVPPEIPGFFSSSKERLEVGEASPPAVPSIPEEYSGPASFDDQGSTSRVAKQDGTVKIDVRCINEKGSMIYVSIGGQTVFNWVSDSTKSYDEMKQEWSAEEFSQLEKENSLKGWHNKLKRDYVESFSVRAGQKIKTKYVGKTASDQRSWFNLSGPF